MKEIKKEIVIVFSVVSLIVITFMGILLGTDLIIKRDKVDLEIDIKYICEKDYTLKGKKCYSNNEISLEKPSCEVGKLTGSVCLIRKTVGKEKTCDKGDQDNGSLCEKNLVVNALDNKKCETGYTLNANQCTKDSGVSPTVTEASCKANEVLKEKQDSGVLCYSEPSELPEGSLKCPEGKYLVNGKCYASIKKYNNTKTCSQGKLIKDKCLLVSEVNHEYSCKDKTYSLHPNLKGKCRKVTTYQYKYKCPQGFIEDIDEKSCIKDDMVKAVTLKTCDKKDGYELIDGKCHKVVDANQSCKKGYVLFSNKCIRDE